MRPKSNIYAIKAGENGWDIRAGSRGKLFLGGVSRVLRQISALIEDKEDVVSIFVQVKRKK